MPSRRLARLQNGPLVLKLRNMRTLVFYALYLPWVGFSLWSFHGAWVLYRMPLLGGWHFTLLTDLMMFFMVATVVSAPVGFHVWFRRQ